MDLKTMTDKELISEYTLAHDRASRYLAAYPETIAAKEAGAELLRRLKQRDELAGALNGASKLCADVE